MKRIKQYPKAFVCLVILVVAVVGALIVSSVSGDQDCGYTVDGIWYSASVGDLRYEDPFTKSYHRIYVENDADFTIKIAYRFAHLIFKNDKSTPATAGPGEPPKQQIIEEPNGPIVEPGTYNDNERTKTLKVDVSDLPPGPYWINAYTELEIMPLGSTVRLMTARAEEWFQFNTGG